MKVKNIILPVLLLFSIITPCWSHALWIETSPTGEKSQRHEIKIYYGEYAEGKIESLPDWYSDTKDFELWLVLPTGEKQKLETAASDTHFEASFIPDNDGDYSLYISHSAKDLGGKTLYQFNTSAAVKIGQISEPTPEIHNFTELTIIPDKGSNNTYQVYFKGQASAGTSVELAGPTGWSKVYVSDNEGKVSIETPWEGAYLLEATKSIKSPGQLNGNAYQGIWRCATYRIDNTF